MAVNSSPSCAGANDKPNGVNGNANNGADTEHNLPPLTELIAKYGDSSNTTWIEDKFSIWRHPPTGAAQGFATPSTSHNSEADSAISHGIPKMSLQASAARSKGSNYLVAWGRPLCASSDLSTVISAFLKWSEKEGYNPLWCCADKETERVLAEEHKWRAISCIQEDALDPRAVNPEESKEVRRHIKAAEKAGCRVIQEDGVPPKDIRDKVDELIQEWKNERTGTQVHVTNVEPWRDPDHRKYFYVVDSNGNVVGFLFLAQIAEGGWAIKDSLASKNAPKNLTEWLITTAIHTLGESGSSRLTFGPTPAEDLVPAENAKSTRPTVKFLSKAYGGIERHVLGSKREFRSKFNVDGEPIWICYPPTGLGRHGISAIMKVLMDE